MKVAIICPYSFSVPGGVQNQVRMQKNALQKRGIDARVIAPYYGPSREQGVYSIGEAKHFNINGSIAPVAAGKINATRTLEFLDLFNPDIVHLHEPLVPGPCWAALYGARAPLIATFHAAGNVNTSLQYILKRPAQLALSKLSARIAVSEEAKRVIQPALGDDKDCEIISNAIETINFKGQLTDKSRDPIRVFFVGRHEERKGLSVLLRAWSQLKTKNVELRVAGDGPETDYLKSLDISNIKWLGRISDEELRDEYTKASILCAPALYGESFGVILLEAMASHAIVLASDINGYNQVATRESAVLFEKANVADLVEKLSSCIDEVESQSKWYRDKVADAYNFSREYDINTVIEKYIQKYNEVLESGKINLSLTDRSEAIKLATTED